MDKQKKILICTVATALIFGGLTGGFALDVLDWAPPLASGAGAGMAAAVMVKVRPAWEKVWNGQSPSVNEKETKPRYDDGV